MQTPSYVALSRQVVLQRQLTLTANNIANINTVGFKRQSMLFEEHLSKAQGDRDVSYVMDRGSVRDMTPGQLRNTGAALDMAIEGDGYFTIETAVGPRYGRAGQFQLNQDNQVVTFDGYPLLDQGGAPITVPAGAADIKIAENGAFIVDGQQAGRVQLVRFEKNQQLIHTAEGLYKSDEEPVPADDAKVRQGMLENSNVNPVVSLVHMLEIQRDYEGNHRMIKQEGDRMTRAIRELGRVEQA